MGLVFYLHLGRILRVKRERDGTRPMDTRAHALGIVAELKAVLLEVDPHEVEELVGAVLGAEKVFFVGVGRVFLALQFLAKRMAHLGIDAQVVGSVTEKPISQADLLIVGSGSGESRVPIAVAEMAKGRGATVALITSAPSSTLRGIADLVVVVPCPTRIDPLQGVHSVQPMTNLFDQALHLLGDAITMRIMELNHIRGQDLWKLHANLE